ncbi:MAG TPA: bifunctional precorrin-2 dehydrogenase/sirohydrochlorin ferrochelatase [Bryobacteraceae bacterium]|nr:bifunctional precorrin-2 dehydrogenase/sirohydrochlorin ferrochelatase [Bryobacteraceae bacterium]
MNPARRFYPLFLDISGKRAVVVGGGRVAYRKTVALIEAGARVTVIAPRFDERFSAAPVERIAREYRAGDLAGARLAFAATDRRNVNARVAREARSLGIPVNVADAPAQGDFIVPARARRANIQIAISTSASNPALAAKIRARIEALLDDILKAELPHSPADN